MFICFLIHEKINCYHLHETEKFFFIFYISFNIILKYNLGEKLYLYFSFCLPAFCHIYQYYLFLIISFVLHTCYYHLQDTKKFCVCVSLRITLGYIIFLDSTSLRYKHHVMNITYYKDPFI